jgi:ribosome maturation factor RimP
LRRGAGPSFLLLMILVKDIEKLVADKLEGTDKFLVEIKVSPTNVIAIEFDADSGINAQDCKDLSKYVESELDRENEDFALTVSSPGLDKPLRILRQYQKNIGRSIKVIKNDGNRVQGTLEQVKAEFITLNWADKKKKESKIIELPFNEIKESKVIISFK